jgi:16S rRNA (adenine1518-N6/adenine1519-N6)-dimethyltransferase
VIFARKRFGQHFLHDRGVLERIARELAPQPDQALVEIGPGRGALTELLVGKSAHLECVEIDRDLAAALTQRWGAIPEFELHTGDALECDFAALAARRGQRLRVIGNLPYNISTPLLFHLLDAADVVQDMHFMLQKEVVRRMAAAPGDEDYGRLTVTIAARASVDELFTVAPGAFWPPPQVDSAVVRMRPRPPPFPIGDLAQFDRVVKAAFGQRRKTLANALRGVASAEAFARAGIDPKVRGETLSAADFARLSNCLQG